MKIVLTREEVEKVLILWAAEHVPAAHANTVTGLHGYSNYDKIELFHTEPVQQELPL